MRTQNLFWGIVVLLLGVLLLVGNFFPGLNVWGLFWPVLLILAGVWFLLGPRLFAGRKLETQHASTPLGGATEAEVKLHHGAGRLEVTALNQPGLLMDGDFTGGVEQKVRTEGSLLRLKLKSGDDAWMMFPFGITSPGLEWKLGLSRDIPIRLSVESGASEAILDLSALRISELKVQTGASSTRITLPANAGFTRVKAESGAAAMNMRVPDGVAASIRVESGLSGINIDRNRFTQNGNLYETPGYATAVNKVEIHIESGVGSVTVM